MSQLHSGQNLHRSNGKAQKGGQRQDRKGFFAFCAKYAIRGKHYKSIDCRLRMSGKDEHGDTKSGDANIDAKVAPPREIAIAIGGCINCPLPVRAKKQKGQPGNGVHDLQMPQFGDGKAGQTIDQARYQSGQKIGSPCINVQIGKKCRKHEARQNIQIKAVNRSREQQLKGGFDWIEHCYLRVGKDRKAAKIEGIPEEARLPEHWRKIGRKILHLAIFGSKHATLKDRRLIIKGHDRGKYCHSKQGVTQGPGGGLDGF